MQKMFTLILLLLLSVASTFAVCPANLPRTTVIYVNGIWTSLQDAEASANGTQIGSLKTEFRFYMAGRAKLPNPDCVQFKLSYNNSQGFQDLLESFALLSKQDAQHLATTPITLNDLPDELKAAAMVTVAGYAQALGKHLHDSLAKFGILPTNPSVAQQDLKNLVDAVLAELKVGNKVVLIGHSEGNLFVNAAYDYILQWQSQLLYGTGIVLPNINKLEAIGIATPADHVADHLGVSDTRNGKQRYTTSCVDFISGVPLALQQNTSGTSSPILVIGPILNFFEEISCAQHVALEKFSAALDTLKWLSIIDKLAVKIAGGSVTVQAVEVKTFSEVWWSLEGLTWTDRFNSIMAHLFDSYMTRYYNTWWQVMRDLEDTLPDPACNGDVNCYLKDGFSTPYSDGNWNLTTNAGVFSGIREFGGVLELDSLGFLLTRGELTLRDRRVFTGPFIGNISFNHMGNCQSSIRLKKAVDDSLALALTINNCSGQDSVSPYPTPTSAVFLPVASGFKGWHKVTFAKTDTQVTMSVDGNGIWAQNTSGASDSYYIEIDSQGDNTLQIMNLSVNSSGTSVTTPQTPTISNLVVLGTALANTPFDMTVTGTNIVAGQVQAWVFDSGFTACLFGCRQPDSALSSVTPTGLTVHIANLDVGIHYLQLRNTDSGIWSNVSPAFTVSPLIPVPPTVLPATQSVSVAAGLSIPALVVLQNQSSSSASAAMSLWCMQATCPAGISYNFPTSTSLSAYGSFVARITFYTSLAAISGTYNYEYRVVFGSNTIVAKISLVVTAPIPSGDFTAAAVSSSVSVQQGSNGTLQFTATPSGGFTGAVTVAVTGAPTGVTITPASGSITGTGAVTLVSTVSVASTATAGSYPLTATFSGGGKTKTVPVTLVVTQTTPTTGTINITSNMLVSCSLNSTPVVPPTSLANMPAGSYTLSSCIAPVGYTIFSISPSSQTLVGGSTITFAVVATANAPTTGTVNVSFSGYNGTATCSLNGVSFTAPASLANQPAGTKTLACTSPGGTYYVASISPSLSQNLVGGGTVNFIVVMALAL